MSAEINNLVSDAVADPPRFHDDTKLKEQIRIEEQKKQKTPPNPEINNDISNKLNGQRANQGNGNGSDDRDSNDEKEQERKPKRKSRKGSGGGTTINNIVKDSTNVYFNFSTQTQINLNANGTPTSKRDREKSQEPIREMPLYIKSLIGCQTKITTEDKLIAKNNIGKNWKIVAKKLGLKKGEVEQCYLDHSQEGIQEVIYHYLTVWEHTHGKLATLGSLMKALWAAEEYDCAEELAIIHRPAN